jgi:hypothetical protein
MFGCLQDGVRLTEDHPEKRKQFYGMLIEAGNFPPNPS